MPSNPLSYVPMGRDDTGAAVVLKPFDSSGIWDTYDRMRAQPKKPLLDSFGKPIDMSGAGIHPNDIPYVQEGQNNYLNRYAQIMAQAQKERRDIDGQELAELSELKTEAQNRVKLAQLQFTDARKTEDEIRKDPYGYSDDAIQQIWNPFNTPINKGRQISWGVDRLAPGTSMTWLKNNSGRPWKKQERGTKRADGSFRNTEEYIFDEAQARKDYRERIVPQYGTKEGRIYVSSLKPDLELVAKQKYNTDFASLPQATQAEIMDEVGEENYVNFMRGQMPKESSIKTGAAPLDKKKGSGRGSSTTPIDDQPVIRRIYAPYKGKERVIKGTGEGDKYDGEGDKYELLDVLEFPVTGLYGSKGPREESQLFWEDEKGEMIFGDVTTIRQFRDKNGSWGNDMWATLTYKDEDGNEKTKEIKLSGYNKKQFKTEFGYDPQEVRDRKYSNWKEQFEEKLGEVKSPETDPFWSTYSESKKKMLMEAYERKVGKSKALNYEGVKNLGVDPDAKYQRK